MTVSKSTKSKPEKPYPEFPLFAHSNGQWCRKIRGKRYFFGVWDDPTAALERHNKEYASLKEGVAPASRFTGWRLGDLVNRWLEIQDDNRETGEIVESTFEACKHVGGLVVEYIDRNRAVESLTPDDFRAFRSSLLKRYSKVTAHVVMVRARQIFNFAYAERMISKPAFYGKGFDLLSKTVIRKERHAKPKKLFTPEQIHLLLKNASPALKAMILLAINAGVNNADLGNMKPHHIEDGWLDYPRHKTGVERIAPLWPETIAAIENYLKVRQEPLAQFESFLFITKARRKWGHSSLPSEFRN